MDQVLRSSYNYAFKLNLHRVIYEETFSKRRAKLYLRYIHYSNSNINEN